MNKKWEKKIGTESHKYKYTLHRYRVRFNSTYCTFGSLARAIGLVLGQSGTHGGGCLRVAMYLALSMSVRFAGSARTEGNIWHFKRLVLEKVRRACAG